MTETDFTNSGVPINNFFGGNFDVSDVETTGTPIIIPGTGTFVQLTNDGQGTQTSSAQAPNGITELWDIVNDEFDFSQLKLGDKIDIRLDVDVITSAPNTLVEVRMEAGLGVFAFPIGWDSQFYGSAGTFPLVRSSFVTMQTAAILTGKAEFQLKADNACTVIVNGWNYHITQKGN